LPRRQIQDAIVLYPHLSKTQSFSLNFGRILNGVSAYEGQFPYIAALNVVRDGGIYFCASSLLSDEVLSTAAHCIEDASSVTVIAGTTYWETLTPNGEERLAQSYGHHREFNGEHTNGNALSILEMF